MTALNSHLTRKFDCVCVGSLERICSTWAGTTLSTRSLPSTLSLCDRNWPLIRAPIARRRGFSFRAGLSPLRVPERFFEINNRAVAQRDQGRHITTMAVSKSEYLSDVWKDGIFGEVTPLPSLRHDL